MKYGRFELDATTRSPLKDKATSFL